jgi:hypothetical protein
LHDRVTEVDLAGNGDLRLTFSSGLAVLVLAADHAVSWTALSSDRSQASCIAEGRVVWQ